MPPADFAITTGSLKIDPADARITLELNALTVPSPSTTPALPNASAERRIVPRFPGSCSPTTTTIGPTCKRSKTSSVENCFTCTSAATPCGASLGTLALKSLSGSSRVSTCVPICGSRRSARFCADSRKNTAWNFSPLRIASSRMRTPSMAQNPSAVGSAHANACRNSFTSALCRPSMRRRRCRPAGDPSCRCFMALRPLAVTASYSASRCGLFQYYDKFRR
jgi:hypothetical protein